MTVTDNVGTQTEAHPIESYIDKDYKWNVWDMLRDAIHWVCTSAEKTYKIRAQVPV